MHGIRLVIGLTFRRLGVNTSVTAVGIDRVKVGATPARQDVILASDASLSPVGSIGTIVTGTPTAVTRTVQAGWTYVLVAASGSGANGIGEITVKYKVP